MKKFTLMELLIVITILGILWSILLPSLQRTRAKTRQAVCLSNQKQVATAAFSYLVDDGRYLPQNFAYGNQWIKRLIPAYFEVHIRSESILQCPDGVLLPNDQLNTSNVAMNIFLSGKQRADGSTVTSSYNAIEADPVETCLLMESYRDWPGAHPWLMTSSKIKVDGNGYKIARHLNRANTIFLDGHTESLKDTKLINNGKYGDQQDTFWDPTK
jgi:prepilin-type N-terminal cleavage/methylation domain-containing protein/prepilin-type processing-associated H-X9-DG protein